ncbi:MAG: HlyC/CorC family transporter [Gammaproteobacteria bacterium]
MTTTQLFIILGILLLTSAFFSGSETALMRVSTFRLRALARGGSRGARLAEKLLSRPDRLIGLILAGNNAVNFAASAITVIIAQRLGGQAAVGLATVLLVFVVLIFAELTPKTLAALHPERVALPASIIYYPLMFVFSPIVMLVNAIANGLLRLFGVPVDADSLETLTRDELHATVAASSGVIPARRQSMLLRILELEEVTVEDIMVPRADIHGIDLEDDWPTILADINSATHTRLPVFRENLDQVEGMLHLRSVVKALARDALDKDGLIDAVIPAYFVPEDTPLNKQLVNFQSARQRLGLVVDEYGDLQGMVTLDDLLQEIVGDYSLGSTPTEESVNVNDDGSFVVSGTANVRALNRTLRWQLPVTGAKTLNGLITEHLQTIPESGTELDVGGYKMTVLRTQGNAISSVRVVTPPASDNDD